MADLETLLSQATNPATEKYNSETISRIVHSISKSPDGVQTSLRLLVHKIHSPQEKESLLSLSLLEALSLQCGPEFHAELGKFKFLNEMIKLLSPKYLGNATSAAVKDKCAQLLYIWQRDLGAKEPKFVEVYQILRQQCIIRADPDPSIDYSSHIKPNVENIFANNTKSEKLARLLKSRNPVDLRAANELIKCMVKEDQVRIEKATEQCTQMKILRNNTLLLEEMIAHYRSGDSTEAEKEVMQELVQNIRTALLLQSELCETEILESCVTRSRAQNALRLYDGTVHSKNGVSLLDPSVSRSPAPPASSGDTAILARDLLSLDMEDDLVSLPTEKSELFSTTGSQSVNRSDLEEIFSSHNLVSTCSALQPSRSEQNSALFDAFLQPTSSSHPPPTLPSSLRSGTQVNWMNKESTSTTEHSTTTNLHVFKELDDFGRQMLGFVNSANTTASQLTKLDDPSSLVTEPPTNDDQKQPHSSTTESQIDGTDNAAENVPSSASTTPNLRTKFNDILIQLNDIKPHPTRFKPLILYPSQSIDETTKSSPFSWSIQLALHPAANKPTTETHVFVAVLTSQHPTALNDILLRFAVDKPCRLRHLTPSATSLPPYSAFLPPSAVSQILLILNPTHQQTCQLKYQLSFTADDENVLESGRLDHLPIL